MKRIAELVQELKSESLNPKDLCAEYLQRIKAHESLNVFLGTPGHKLDEYLKAIEGKKDKKLYGIPIAVKDNISIEDWDLSCASQILQGYVAPYHSTVMKRLLEEGAIPLGRTNMDEFAFGSSCETSFFGPTKNPWNETCVPGGSSGGSAAAVAAHLAPAALGSDTGGSIRQPASFCGVVGLKPTYGRVSRFGLVAFASSLDQIGPFAHSVQDAALILEIIAGYDPNDSTSANIPVPEYTRSLGESIKGVKIGIPKEYMQHDLEPDMKKAIYQAIAVLSKEGAIIEDISLPHTEYAVSVYYVVGPCEASSNLARFDGVKYGYRDKAAESLAELFTQSREKGFGREAKRRIILGTYALSSGYYDAYYLKAMKVRKKMIEDFDNAFKQVDAILTPTSPGGAFKIGEKTEDPLQMYLSDIFTISANLSGIPAISIPCGKNKDNLPLGIQFMSKPYTEESLLQIASVYESKAGFEALEPLESRGN